MDNERLKTLLYNALVFMENERSEEYTHEELLEELGMTEEEYGAIMVPESDIHYFDVHFATEPDGSGFSVFVTASDETSAVSIARAKNDAYDEINDYVEEIDEDEYKRAIATGKDYGTVKTPEPKKIPLDKLRKLSCPCCGKFLIALEPYEIGSALFWCDDCKIDINIETNEEVSVCKDGSKIETAAGTLVAQPYDDGCAKGMKLIIKDEIIGMCDVTEDGEIRLLGYHEGSDEPSICYSINR